VTVRVTCRACIKSSSGDKKSKSSSNSVPRHINQADNALHFRDLPVMTAEEDNPAYDGGLALMPSRQLGQQSELVRDTSVIRNSQDTKWLRGRFDGSVLSRFMSDISDVSNSTTSTFVSSQLQEPN